MHFTESRKNVEDSIKVSYISTVLSLLADYEFPCKYLIPIS